jgi:ABC-type glutathione transport system ATPase component
MEQNTSCLITDLNVHKLLLVAAVIAAKFHEDHYYSNNYYANVGGVSTWELAKLEVHFMIMLGWRVHVREDEYNDSFHRLCNGDELFLPREKCEVDLTLQSGASPEGGVQAVQESLFSTEAAEDAGDMLFTLPRPCALEGVKSRKKVILRMESANLYHDGQSGSLTLSQASRALIVGAERAGKTTLTKLLAGETACVEIAPRMASGCCLSCITEHSLQCLDEHMHMTPEQYMLSRFATDGSQEQLEARAIQEFFQSFGVEQDVIYKQIEQLSHATKVRVCLAVAMWPRPHILILDEPAKLLNPRDLQALLHCIKSYTGGVLITSHTRDEDLFEGFAEAKFFLREGKCPVQGKSAKVPASARVQAHSPWMRARML